MKHFLLSLFILSCQATGAQPSAVQQQLIDRAYGMFIHFGPNTFQNLEWSDGTAPASVYNPTRLDCRQWVRVARQAGFRYVLLVAKHHDGFCLWDSQWTDYDVAASPVTTDVVRAVSDACRAEGLGFALYYSLWDRHESSYREPNFNRYILYMERQLTELLTQYGDVCELWLDGAWDKPVGQWQLPRLYQLVKRLQPNCAMGVNHTVANRPGEETYTWDDLVLPDSCRADNTHYLRFFPSDFRLWDPKIAPLYDAKRYLYDGQSHYLPFEHTICLSKSWNWFQKDAMMPVRDVDELEELFYWTTANQNTLVIDVAPDREGLIRDHEANAVLALAQRLGIAVDDEKPLSPPDKRPPLPRRPLSAIVSLGATATATSVWDNDERYAASRAVDGGMQTRWAASETTAALTLELDSCQAFNRVVIFEYQDQQTGADGFSNVRTGRIQRYTIDLLMHGQWHTVYVGDQPLGDCKVVQLPRHYAASRLRLNILQASAPPSVWELLVVNHQPK